MWSTSEKVAHPLEFKRRKPAQQSLDGQQQQREARWREDGQKRRSGGTNKLRCARVIARERSGGITSHVVARPVRGIDTSSFRP